MYAVYRAHAGMAWGKVITVYVADNYFDAQRQFMKEFCLKDTDNYKVVKV